MLGCRAAVLVGDIVFVPVKYINQRSAARPGASLTSRAMLKPLLDNAHVGALDEHTLLSHLLSLAG